MSISVKPIIAIERRAQLVRHVGEELAFETVSLFDMATPFIESQVFQPKLLGQSALGDVPQNHGEQFRSAVRGLGNRSFDGKLLTTGAQPEDGAKGVQPFGASRASVQISGCVPRARRETAPG